MGDIAAPTFPSLLAEETKDSITEYLSTTFALADPNAGSALSEFLRHPETGIFRGPYLKVRTPYQQVPGKWTSPLEWMPKGFRPFRHQATAFERLSTRSGAAQPTIVTTGTGSGKTESFLVPLLDHARRAAARGEEGIKAIILYPMNALVTDQARRLANYLHDDPQLSEVTAGVYIGGQGRRRTPTRNQLVDNRDELRKNPPDILLTNYKMLDLLLLRAGDNPLWDNAASTLQYLVLDEFHTYDGAQGTDVAMLIRRLGARIGVSEAGRPLGRVTPVATSATLGGGSRSSELRDFAETIFGTEFSPESLVAETSLTAADVVPHVDFGLDIPAVDVILEAPTPDAAVEGSWEPLARAVLEPATEPGVHAADIDYADPVEIGDALRTHFLTRAVIDALSGEPLTPAEAVTRITQAGVLPWGVHNASRPAEVQQALLKFLALLSVARVRDDHGSLRPLLNVQVQLWVRELTRMLRQVSQDPGFDWWHDGPPADGTHLPAVHCRVCGHSGWMTSTTELGDSFAHEPQAIWRDSARLADRRKTRTLLLADAADQGVTLIDADTLEVASTPNENTIAVHCTPDEEQAVEQTCPACGARNAIRFLGSSVATLLSVGLTSEFGSPLLADGEKKTLVFTDSVQDAAHRAAFIEGRAFQFNFRSALLAATSGERTTLQAAAERLFSDTPTAQLYSITPPDFVRRTGVEGAWLDHDSEGWLRDLLDVRIAFQAHLETGLNARMGRTLELTGAVAVDIDIDLDHFASLARDIHQNLPQLSLTLSRGPAEQLSLDVPDDRAKQLAIDIDAYAGPRYDIWILGLVEQLRTTGGIHHRWLARYIRDEGKRWSIWGGSAEGMPKFPAGRPAPGFLTTGAAGDTDFIALGPRGESRLTDWTRRCLGVTASEARALLADVVDVLAGEDGPLERRAGEKGSKVYGLTADRIILDPTGIARLQCPVCHHVQPTTSNRTALWDGAPCPRMRCPGTLAPVEIEPANFYRTMYRSGRIRRIVSEEHTGLLDREEREEVEARFKMGGSPVDPNILACTPTLELGIDIGDLSTVALASLPRSTANYLQRIGRAGRSTGNAFVLAAVPSSPRDLYYFAEPTHLLAGEVLPPGAYLNATELLHRQFFAFALDRLAAGGLGTLPAMPSKLGGALGGGMDDGAWLRSVVDAVTADADALSTDFLVLFGNNLVSEAQQAVRAFAEAGLRDEAARVALAWQTETDEIRKRLNELAQTVAELDRHGHLDDQQKDDRKRCMGESRALGDQLRERGRQETLTGLSGVGLLPNYNLLDDATTLDVHLWWTANEGSQSPEPQALDLTYERSSSTALTELAPGAYFYANGKRVQVDAVDAGPLSQPLWSRTRLCPSCGWGTTNADAPLTACPRCHSGAVTDSGAVHKVLPLQKVSAVHRLDDVLIDDDADDRTRTFFTKVTGVDIDPADIVDAWKLKATVFGAEYARSAVIRSLNVGLGDAPGSEAIIAGETVAAAGFTTCSHCGVVATRPTEKDRTRHRGYCATRRGTAEKWERLLLSHELRTQAVRLLLPVSLLHFETTMTSFKGALLLGLRRDFGGDPQHLAVVASSMSDGSGSVRRFLVLHDTVPGGTGYLDRFGQPDRLRGILTLARDVLATCPCRLEGRAACHRCLYGVLSSREIPHASRESALRLLDEFLGGWEVETIPTVSTVDIAKVQLSELELQFREAIKDHIASRDGWSVEAAVGSKGEELDLRLANPNGEPRRWRMRPLVDLKAGSITTQPDFLFTRSDAQGCDVAVYLDGQKYHASVEHNITDDDARKRDALRRDGRRVWSIAWDDVQSFVSKSLKAAVPDLLHQQMQNTASAGIDDPRLKTLWGNPIDFLIEYLADPDADVWGAGANGTVLAIVNPGKHGSEAPIMLAPGSLVAGLNSFLAGQTPASDPTGSVMVVPRTGLSGLPLVIVADPNDHVSTLGVLCVLDDRPSEVGGPSHVAHWRDWLRWSNVLQFLTRPRFGLDLPMRMVEIWTRRSDDPFAGTMIPLAGSLPGKAEDAAIELTPEWSLVRDYTDPVLAQLIAIMAREGVDAPEAGAEVGPDESVWQVELAWPDTKVAVVVDIDADRDEWLEKHGWTVASAEGAFEPDTLAREIEDAVKGSTQ
ncbi:DEAD/DEAH box helicase [Prescottella agglutinans]|uniref:DEAD/DEAH box helicase n=1 Tax=Prescottella agglutinans TaxID=1644129 RepID=A0A438BB31_9NOCA|nr:DEAD/DEAH box helicase [Prescottella agglutinans]RVW08226.1 DEAD/DEAH box helicase [Prescottella agglutinans]